MALPGRTSFSQVKAMEAGITVTPYRNSVEKITKQAKALGAEYLRQYSAKYLRLYEAEYLRLYRMSTALEVAHEKARQILENSLPPRPGAF
jgi:hypothetical protein